MTTTSKPRPGTKATVEIRTQDEKWIAKNGVAGRDGRWVVEVEVEDYMTFGAHKKEFVCFTFPGKMPKDWANKNGCAPVEWIVA